MSKVNNSNSVILESSLQTFFFDELERINKKFESPISKEKIFYSSLVMDRFSLSDQLFEVVDGRKRDKVLGVKLLESSQLSGRKKKELISDVAETSLFICGYFSDSVKDKLVDLSYYREVGQSAYRMLNTIVPSFYEIDSFYYSVSKNFDVLANLMSLVQKKTSTHFDSEMTYLITNRKVS